MKLNMGAVIFCVGALLVVANVAYSSEYHHHDTATTVNNYQANSNGVALGVAIGQHQFDASTFAWQGSISTGSYDDSTAFSFGLAKRFKATLISGSVANEGGKLGYGASMGWKF